MKKKIHSIWYTKNHAYTSFLDSQEDVAFAKYTKKVYETLESNGTFLDVGCGTGIALAQLKSMGIPKTRLAGIEISKTSAQICRKKGFSCGYYEGKRLPFTNATFSTVGSINVLEHTDNPINFLNELHRVTKKGGYIIVVCPNFLSITNSYHHHTRGIMQKISNMLLLMQKCLTAIPSFEKMKPIEKDIFSPDDDAVVVTNPVDIIQWADKKKLYMTYWSSQQREDILNHVDKWPFKIILGSCFFIFKKT